MTASVVNKVEQLIPRRMRLRYAYLLDPMFEQAVDIIYGTSDRAISRRTALYAYAIRIASALIAYVSQVLLARWMGEYEYGIFVIVWISAVILGGISCIGFHTAVVRLIPEYQSANSFTLLRGLLFASRTWSIAVATFLAIVGVAGIYIYPEAIQNYYVLPFYLAAICLPMLALSEVQDGIARAFDLPFIALSPTFLIRPVLILIFMAAAVMAGFEADATTALGATIVATWFVSIGQLLKLNKKLRQYVPVGSKKSDTMTWFAISVPIFLVEGFFNLQTNIDILMIGWFMPPEQTAVYFAAAKTLALVHFVYFAVKAGSAHRFAQYLASDDKLRYASIINDTIRWTFWPSAVMCVVLLITGKYLLMLFGSPFTAGYPLLFIFVVGLLARASVGPAESVLTMSGEQNLCAAVYMVTLTFNIALNFILIPIYGLAGAATATTIALIFEAIALYVVTLHRLGVHMFIIPIWNHDSDGSIPTKVHNPPQDYV